MVGSRRVHSLLMALLVVAGTFGFSTVDALLYHRQGMELGTRQPHYEPAGTTCGHADRCVLGVTFSGPRVATPASVVGRLTGVLRIAGLLPPPAKPHDADRYTLPQPRAPPTLPA
jgi:hypothetical protein